MKIKRLEISGFKSFADRIIIDFQQQVTGVVGPNGCGKSNIVDAIRWCMGEQSAKHLRGKSMEDVIFAGSETRKPLGMAEVSLTFSTEDGRAPGKYLEYVEIQLTRRLYRDGESDYLINKTPCRLLDITELFMDTGVGTRAYSIIEQGKIGQILHSRPEERRFLIEEAAGVTKFKSRKQVALKKIESTRQNLARLADVLGEIKRQLSSLQRQAKKAEKFREYRDEAREIDLLFAAQNYKELMKQRYILQEELTIVESRISELDAAAIVADSNGETTRLVMLEAEKLLNSSQEAIYRLKSEFSAAENGEQFHKKEITSINSRLKKLVYEVQELDTRIKESTSKQELLLLRKDASTVDTSTLAVDLIRLEGVLAEQQGEEERLNRALEINRKDLFNRLSEIAQSKTRNENTKKRQAQLLERLQQNKHEALQMGERLDAAEKRCTTVKTDIVKIQAGQTEIKSELVSLHEEELKLANALLEIEKNWQLQRDELNRFSSRLHSLKELEAQFAGFGQGVKNLMKSSGYRSHFSGVLADAIKSPPDLEAAVEAVLADRLQALICRDSHSAIEILNHLRSANAGRVMLALPFESITKQNLATPPFVLEDNEIKPPNYPVMLLNRLEFSGSCAPLLTDLLSSVLLVDSMQNALLLAAEYPGWTYVTIQGDLVRDGGIISGGSSEQLQTGIIHKKREIRELESRVAILDLEVARLAGERDLLKRHSQELASRLNGLNTVLHQIELKLAGLQKDRQQAEDEVARVSERQMVQGAESETLNKERLALENELLLTTATIVQSETATQTMDQELAILKQELDTVRVLLASTREQVTTTRVQVATVKEQHEAHLRELSVLQQQITDMKCRFTVIGEEMQDGRLEQERLQITLANGTIHLEKLLADQTAAEVQLQKARQEYEQALEVASAGEAHHKQLRDEIDAIRSRHSELTLSFSTATMQAEHAEQGILEKSRINMADALARLETTDFDQEVRKQRRQELQRTLDEMGEVNLMAIDEYATMEERFSFLSSQKDDLEESLHSLQQAIQRINRTTRQRFQETYNLVNATFKEVFPRLFCGGYAELRLTNEDDLLETGIDIIVQPPGKKLQNVTLLSGGEKALTAVALIFSIFLIKPTPFCLLDEVDAPLDDANIGRFNEMVREMSSNSQFIIITHNKATMQVADTLYGITMEEPGSSKVVSVRLH